jgi:hypothetical protein
VGGRLGRAGDRGGRDQAGRGARADRPYCVTDRTAITPSSFMIWKVPKCGSAVRHVAAAQCHGSAE